MAPVKNERTQATEPATRRTGSRAESPRRDGRLVAAADRHAARIAFALAQLASRIEASDGSEIAAWRIRQCEAILQATVRRALAEMMPREDEPASMAERLELERVAA